KGAKWLKDTISWCWRTAKGLSNRRRSMSNNYKYDDCLTQTAENLRRIKLLQGSTTPKRTCLWPFNLTLLYSAGKIILLAKGAAQASTSAVTHCENSYII